LLVLSKYITLDIENKHPHQKMDETVAGSGVPSATSRSVSGMESNNVTASAKSSGLTEPAYDICNTVSSDMDCEKKRVIYCISLLESVESY